MKATIGLVIIIVGVIVTFNVFLPGGNGEPVATPTLPAQAVHVESTATPAPTATPQPISGAPVRVNFDNG